MRKYWHKKKRQATFEWIVIITNNNNLLCMYLDFLKLRLCIVEAPFTLLF